MEKVESLPAKKIAKVLNGFIQQYGIKSFSAKNLMWVNYSGHSPSHFKGLAFLKGYFYDQFIT